MDERPYPFEFSRAEYTYSFESISDKKTVRKVVVFTDIEQQRIFNLALMDEESDGTLSDSNVTNNDDLKIVLATVFRIIAQFMNEFPKSFVFLAVRMLVEPGFIEWP